MTVRQIAAALARRRFQLSESTGCEAKTIHRLLEADPLQGGFRRKEDHPLQCDLLVVDETSMGGRGPPTKPRELGLTG